MKYQVVYRTMSDGTAVATVEAADEQAARAAVKAREDCDKIVSAAQVE